MTEANIDCFGAILTEDGKIILPKLAGKVLLVTKHDNKFLSDVGVKIDDSEPKQEK